MIVSTHSGGLWRWRRGKVEQLVPHKARCFIVNDEKVLISLGYGADTFISSGGEYYELRADSSGTRYVISFNSDGGRIYPFIGGNMCFDPVLPVVNVSIKEGLFMRWSIEENKIVETIAVPPGYYWRINYAGGGGIASPRIKGRLCCGMAER